ncbi:ABC transporter substrate-binding protein [Leucothrix arctica]|uniref:Sugar ABC transporter substrate-binding protein n=1 Tax=Leucothrix arctica TaxID=1481894 RepID=A0A317C4T5_9GAMM|nr:ABC transporter substrate-binding protein [Leucothrix arctica]PWQ93614.1 hypothetical protein DKT75_18525 [Leucothrix arctica]
MFKKIKIITIVSFCTIIYSSALQAKGGQPEVELSHWWNQPGELQAVDEIRKAVEQRGAKFVETRIASWDSLRSNILKRISMGYAPAVTQWLANDYTFSFEQMSAIYPMPSKWRDQPIEEVLFKEVYKGLSSENGLVGLPMGIHIMNSALFSKRIYDELNLTPPKTWSEVLTQSLVIKEAGYVPIALSKEAWQLQVVMGSVLLGELGSVNYKQFFIKGQSIKPWKKPLVRSFETFLGLKKFTDREARDRSWAESVSMIGDNKAAMHFLGDFAKSELTAKGYVAGEDFLCSLAPDSKGYMVYSIDSFLMFNVNDHLIEEGQRILFDVALDPEVQAKYTNKKGGIPVRHGVNVNHLDTCAKEMYQQWVLKDNKTISFTGIGNPLRASFLQKVLEEAWNNDGLTAEELVSMLIEMDEEALTKTK